MKSKKKKWTQVLGAAKSADAIDRWRQKQRRLRRGGKLRDRLRSTQVTVSESLTLGDEFWPKIDSHFEEFERSLLKLITAHHLAHFFDICGSGWVRVAHGAEGTGVLAPVRPRGRRYKYDSEGQWLKGVVNFPNWSESAKIWQSIKGSYSPFDWQLDFKSGYRWSEKKWYLDVLRGSAEGADPRVPMEFGVGQHLPLMALVHQWEPSLRLPLEFSNTICDFVAQNPVRFGVQWSDPLFVSLRLINWIAAYDIYMQSGVSFQKTFVNLFTLSMGQHGDFLFDHIDGMEEVDACYQLAMAVGLLVVSCRLKEGPETKQWRKKAIEIIFSQTWFHEDGSFRHGSVRRHLLQSELLALAVGSLIAFDRREPESQLDLEKEIDQLLQQLEKALQFVEAVTKPTGEIWQLGDNDSLTVLRLSPIYHRMSSEKARNEYLNLQHWIEFGDDVDYYLQNSLIPFETINLLRGMVGMDEAIPVSTYLFDVGQAMMGLETIEIEEGENESGSVDEDDRHLLPMGSDVEFKQLTEQLESGDFTSVSKYQWQVNDETALREASFRCFADAGVFVYSHSEVFLGIHCPVRNESERRYGHRDSLSVELQIGGTNLVVDPGSYKGSTDKMWYDKYRSQGSHFRPRLEGGEDNGNLSERSRVVFVSLDEWLGELIIGDQKVYRWVRLRNRSIEVIDMTSGPRPLAKIPVMEGGKFYSGLPFSPAYGWQRRSEK